MATYNKLIIGGETLFDLTADTITADNLASGVTAHDKSGAAITGTNTYDSDTSADTIVAAEMLYGKTAHARGAKLTGTMPNLGSVTGYIETLADGYTIPGGCHDGGGKVNVNTSDAAKLIPGNLKAGIEILGITGTYSGDAVSAQSKSVTPTTGTQTVVPDAGYDYLASVTVNPIPIVYTDNSAGGTTITIG